MIFSVAQILWLEGFPPHSRKDAVDEVKQRGNIWEHLRERDSKNSAIHLNIKRL